MENRCATIAQDWTPVEDNVDWNELESYFECGVGSNWDSGAYNQNLPFHRRPDLELRTDPDEIYKPPCCNEECPIKRVDFTTSHSADQDVYLETSKKNIRAQPVFKEFLEKFDWEVADTMAYTQEILHLLSNEVVKEHMDALDKFEDPLAHCKIRKTLINRNSSPIDSSVAPKNGEGPNKSNSDLDYLCANWFSKSFGIFETFVAEFKTVHKITSPLKIWSPNAEVKSFAEQDKFKPWGILVNEFQKADLYVFGEGEFDPSVARVVRNIWGLACSVNLYDNSLPCDIHLPRHGSSVELKLPLRDGKMHVHREFEFAFYKNLNQSIPGSGFRYIPSSTFDRGWKRIHFDPVLKKRTETYKYSTWGSAVGIAAATQVPQLANQEISQKSGVLVQTSNSPHGFNYFEPAVRCAADAIEYNEVTKGMLENEAFFPYYVGDRLAHLKLSVGRQTIGLQVDTDSGSVRYIKSKESNFPSTYFGWAIIDSEGFLNNPQFYSMSGRRGMSPINGMSAACFAALNHIGKLRWRAQSPILDVLSPNVLKQSGRLWIIPKYQPCSWLTDNGSFYPPFAFYHPRAKHSFKYFIPPPTTSDAFHLFAHATGLNSLYFSERIWEGDAAYLGKRDLSW